MHAACESTGMILAAEYMPSPLRLILGRHSGIGSRIPPGPFPGPGVLPGNGGGIPAPRFGQETGSPRFPIRPGQGIGVPIRRARDFLVWTSWSRAGPRPAVTASHGVFMVRLSQCQTAGPWLSQWCPG